MTKSNALAGRGIVITRPREQADGLAAAVRAVGGEPILFPTIAIGPPPDHTGLDAALTRLADYDLAIFVSPIAVDLTFARLSHLEALGVERVPSGPSISWPMNLAAAVVGPASVAALQAHGVSKVVAPAQRFDSEGLLERPELTAVAGRSVVIFRGSGGRELLADTLRARGASVNLVSVYVRTQAAIDPQPLIARWDDGGVAAVVFTASEGVTFFAQIVGPMALKGMLATPVFAPHPRIAQTARTCGFATTVTTDTGDVAICAALVTHFRG